MTNLVEIFSNGLDVLFFHISGHFYHTLEASFLLPIALVALFSLCLLMLALGAARSTAKSVAIQGLIILAIVSVLALFSPVFVILAIVAALVFIATQVVRQIRIVCS